MPTSPLHRWWLLGAAGLAVLCLAAAWLALTDRGLDAIKLLLVAFFAPAGALFGVGFFFAVREPGWFRDPRIVSAAVLTMGAVLFSASLIAWVPFSPARWRIDEMPIVLRVPFVASLWMFMGGALTGFAFDVRASWREGDRGRAISGLFVVLLTVGALALAISRRP